MGGTAFSPAHSVLGRRAEHAHGVGSETPQYGQVQGHNHGVLRAQHHCLNKVGVQPEPRPLISAALTAASALGDGGAARTPLPGRPASSSCRPQHGSAHGASLTFKGRGQGGGLGAGGQAADGQVALGAAPVVQHAGVHGRAWGQEEDPECVSRSAHTSLQNHVTGCSREVSPHSDTTTTQWPREGWAGPPALPSPEEEGSRVELLSS